MKKVLMFLDYYDSGGIEKIISDITLFNTEYDYSILSFVNKSGGISLLKRDYRNFFIRNILGIKSLKKYLKGKYYDIIHIHCYNAFGIIYARIFRKYGKKIIIHAHNNGIDSDRFKIKLFINNVIKKSFSTKDYNLIACSKNSSLFCFEKIGSIIPNGVDYSKYKFSNDYRKLYRNKYNFNGKIVICQIGRLEIQKNHLFILDVFSKLIENNKKYRLVIVGCGLLENSIKSRISLLRLDDYVLFINHLDDLDKFYNAVDIVVLPSIYEGFGLVAVEAQINNRYTVISNKVDRDIIISNNCSYLELDKDKWVEVINNHKKSKLILDKKYELELFIKKIKTIYD